MWDAATVFESGAVLFYLAEKVGQFHPNDAAGRKSALEWLFWQTGNQGPMAGQHSHFHNYAPQTAKVGYAAKRYRREYIRTLEVLEERLDGRTYVLGDEYSIADMNSWPWVLIAKAMGVPLDDLPRLSSGRQRIKERPAVQRGANLGKDLRRQKPYTAAERRILFGTPE